MTYKRTKRTKYKRTKRNKKQKGGTYNIKELQNSLEYVDTIVLYEENDNENKNIEVTYNIYKIKIDDFYYYFKNKSFEDHNYIVIIIKNNIYIVKINSDNVKINSGIELQKIKDTLADISKEPPGGLFIIRRILKQNNIVSEIILNYSVKDDNILEIPKNKINELNELLNKRCHKNYRLSLDYMYNLNGKIATFSNIIHYLVLCLYKDNTCISSVELVIHEDYISINLKTLHMYENKKINTLLNAIVIIIGNLFNNIKFIKAIAINPISAYILTKYFKAQIDNDIFIKYLNTKNIENISLKIFEDFKKNNNHFSLTLTIELTDENIENAYRIFNETLLDPKFICNRIN